MRNIGPLLKLLQPSKIEASFIPNSISNTSSKGDPCGREVRPLPPPGRAFFQALIEWKEIFLRSKGYARDLLFFQVAKKSIRHEKSEHGELISLGDSNDRNRIGPYPVRPSLFPWASPSPSNLQTQKLLFYKKYALFLEGFTFYRGVRLREGI